MPFYANQSRDQLRQVYADAWNKHRNRLPLSPLEAQIADLIVLHPEYHVMFNDAGQSINNEWTPEQGQTNPFLHLGLHLAIREQVATDRPNGIRGIHARLAASTSVHDAEHLMIDCLAEQLWNAQRTGAPPNEIDYLDKLKKLG